MRFQAAYRTLTPADGRAPCIVTRTLLVAFRGAAFEGSEMQQCGDCLKIYDESESAGCPYCSDDGDEYTHVIVFDKDQGVAKSVPKGEAHLYH